MKMFYDAVNSSGLDKPVENSKITFNNRTYKIISIDAYYDDNKLHHYEMVLE